MHSIWSRANAIFAFTLTAMSAVTFAVFLSTICSNRIAPVSISAANPRVRVISDYISDHGKSDHAMVNLNIEADVSPIFNWNVKQLFLYLVAEYKTPKNEVNQVVLWDKIVLRSQRSVVIEDKVAPKYYFLDDGQHLLGHENVTLTLRWNIIPNAGYLANAQGYHGWSGRMEESAYGNLFIFLLFQCFIYKYFLANLTLSDLTASALFLVLIPYPTLSSSTYGGIMLGPGKIFQSAEISNWVFVFLVGVFCYGTVALVLTFVYRYVVLCDPVVQRIVFSKKVMYSLYTLIIMFCFSILVTLNAARKYDISVAVKEVFPDVKSIPDSDFFGYSEKSFFLPLNNILCVGCNVGSDIFMGIFGYKTMSLLHHQKSHMRNSTYKMHKRFLHALIIQALLPLFIFCIPVVAFLVSILVQKTSPIVNFVSVLLISLHPATNSLITLYFIRPYRKAFLEFLCCRKFDGNTVSHTLKVTNGTKKTWTSKKKLVLTGFGPFGQYKENPSSVLVSRVLKLGLPQELSGKYELVTTLLDVAYDRVDSYVRDDVRTENAHFYIHVGVHPFPKIVKLECQSQSEGYCRADINGTYPSTKRPCNAPDCGTPEVLETNFDCEKAVESIKSLIGPTELQVQTSTDPGTYLCGYVFYCTLKANEGKSLFVHVPEFDEVATPELLEKVLTEDLVPVMGKRKYEADSDTVDSSTVKRKGKKKNAEETVTEDEVLNGYADTSMQESIQSPPKKKKKSAVNYEVQLDDSLAEVEPRASEINGEDDKIVYWLLRKPKNMMITEIPGNLKLPKKPTTEPRSYHAPDGQGYITHFDPLKRQTYALRRDDIRESSTGKRKVKPHATIRGLVTVTYEDDVNIVAPPPPDEDFLNPAVNGHAEQVLEISSIRRKPLAIDDAMERNRAFGIGKNTPNDDDIDLWLGRRPRAESTIIKKKYNSTAVPSVHHEGVEEQKLDNVELNEMNKQAKQPALKPSQPKTFSNKQVSPKKPQTSKIPSGRSSVPQTPQNKKPQFHRQASSQPEFNGFQPAFQQAMMQQSPVNPGRSPKSTSPDNSRRSTPRKTQNSPYGHTPFAASKYLTIPEHESLPSPPTWMTNALCEPPSPTTASIVRAAQDNGFDGRLRMDPLQLISTVCSS
ncbi:hypothetical protein FO519_000482 [Halicephalobus sp. NKZ332]|nr:hypothetical protein FO519_000482 [Halicephalobus sp. NKZ332]